jgi:hypothetical protein
MALPTGGAPDPLTTDLNTLFSDLLAQASPTQLRADLTAVVTEIRSSPMPTTEIRTATTAVIDFLHSHPTIFGSTST